MDESISNLRNECKVISIGQPLKTIQSKGILGKELWNSIYLLDKPDLMPSKRDHQQIVNSL